MNISPLNFSVSHIQRNDIKQNNKINAQTNNINFNGYKTKDLGNNIFRAVWQDWGHVDLSRRICYDNHIYPTFWVEGYNSSIDSNISLRDYVKDVLLEAIDIKKIQKTIKAQDEARSLVIRPDQVWLIDFYDREIVGTNFPDAQWICPSKSYDDIALAKQGLRNAIERLYQFVSNKKAIESNPISPVTSYSNTGSGITISDLSMIG